MCSVVFVICCSDMEWKALILTLVFTVGNSHDHYGKDRPVSIFGTIPHLLHDMIKGHQNIYGNSYKQQPERNDFFPSNRYGNGMNSGYQQNNMGYQNLGQNSYNMQNNEGLPNPELTDRSEDFTASNPSNDHTEEILTTPLPTTEPAKELLHLSTNSPLVFNLSAPTAFNTNTEHSSNIKRDVNGLTNKPNGGTSTSHKNDQIHNAMHIEPEKNNEPTLNKEKESVKVNKPRNPNAIVFPDRIEEVKRELQDNHNRTAAELPNRFNDTPQILYAVNIAPSDTSQWSSNPSSPLTNSITQNPPLTNAQTFIPTSNQASYATLINPNQVPLTNKIVQPNSFGNSIVLPNSNGGSSLYTIVNLPGTSANSVVPGQVLQSNNIIANPSSYQIQTPIPTANSGVINGMPSYYVVSTPNQPSQTVQTSEPYLNAPVRYTIGYISSNGQTVLVPSSPILYQIVPQTFVPVIQSNVPSSYVPVPSGQQNVISQPVGNQGNAATVTYMPVSSPIGSGQQTYVTVPNSQGNAPNTQINYVPVTNGQGNTVTQPNYVTVSSEQGNTGTPITVVPAAPESTLNNQINYVPVSSDQSNVVTLTSAPSDTMVLPVDNQSVTLLSFKDKEEEKPKKKPSKKKSKKK